MPNNILGGATLIEKVNFVGVSALPSGVLWQDALNGGSDITPEFNTDDRMGLNPGPAAVSSGYLLFERFERNPVRYRKMLFMLHDWSIDTSEQVDGHENFTGRANFCFANRSTQTAHGGRILLNNTNPSSPVGLAQHNNNTDPATSLAIDDWYPLHVIERPLSIGILFEYTGRGSIWRMSLMSGSTKHKLFEEDISMGSYIMPWYQQQNTDANGPSSRIGGATFAAWVR